jgi:ABC-type Fe3+-hydroxamate transport system substrate-binding protein
MSNKIIAIVVTLLLGVSGVAVYALAGGESQTERVDYKSDVTVTDYAGREVSIPTSLDGGIITIGRLSTLRWLAYFPEEFEYVTMVDISMAAEKQGALAYSHAYGNILLNADTHSNDSLEDLEKINFANPSLILVNDSTYKAYKDACEKLAMMNPLAVIDTMSDMETTGFWDNDYKLCDRFVNQADLYGALLKNENRAEDIKGYFQDALDDIRNNCIGETSAHVTYVGGPVNQGSNPLTSTFNPYLPHMLVNGTNALGNSTNSTRIDLTPEEFGNLSFDYMIIEPSTVNPNKEGGNLLVNTLSQGVLHNIYHKNEDSPGSVRMFIIMPMISHSANWLCALTSAYHLAYLEHGIISMDDVIEKSNDLFIKFYGTERGNGVLEGMEEYFENLGKTIHGDLCTELFSEVKVELTSNNEYIFVKV